MNSEFLKNIQISETLKQKTEQEKLELAEAQTIGTARLSEEFMKHPFWKVFIKDLEDAEKSLTDRLINEQNLNKQQIDRIREAIKYTRIFRNHPLKYLQRLQQLAQRKRIK